MKAKLILLAVMTAAILGTLPVNAQSVSDEQTATTLTGSIGQAPSPDEVLAYLASRRNDVALVNYTVAPEGTPDRTDPVLLHNAELPMPLASTIKIVVLAAYAREAAAGRLNSDDTVTLGEWENYYLPGTDGGAHAAALTEFEIPHDEEYGFALDPNATVTFRSVGRGDD